MKTATLVHTTADKMTISSLTKGDVYKRLVTSTYYPDKIVIGVVTDVLHNGEQAVVQATEFETEGTAVDPKQQVFGNETDLVLFPAQPEDIEAHYAEIRAKADRAVSEQQRILDQKVATREHVETVITTLVSAGLTAARAVAYIDRTPEINEDGFVRS